jgi:tetratricopeptide (TPR) repeat protein
MFEAGKKGRRNAGIALAVLILLVGGFLLIRHSSFVTNEPTLSRLASISLSDGQTRFTIWHMAWEGFLARPVTGWGQEGFNYVFNTYFDPALYAQEAWFDRAHNVFLDWLLAGGALALILFLGLLVSAVLAFYRGNVTRNERVMLTAALAAYAFQSLFVFDNLFSYIPLAALLALAHTATARPWKQLQDVPAVSATSAATIGAPIVLVGFVVVCWFVNIPNVSAATDLLSGLSASGGVDKNLAYFKSAASDGSFAAQEISEQSVSFAAALAQQPGQSDAKTAFISFAVDQIKKEIQARPKDARIYLEASLVYRASSDLQDALKTTQAALALSPNKQQILIEEGTTYWQLGDNAKANEDYQKAYELATANDDAAAYAAAGDFLVGNATAGRDLLIGHFGTTTVDNDVLMYVYFQLKMYDQLTAILELRFKNTGSVNDGFRLASAYATFGRYADARAAIQKVIELHPDAASTGQQLLTQLQGK